MKFNSAALLKPVGERIKAAKQSRVGKVKYISALWGATAVVLACTFLGVPKFSLGLLGLGTVAEKVNHAMYSGPSIDRFESTLRVFNQNSLLVTETLWVTSTAKSSGSFSRDIPRRSGRTELLNPKVIAAQISGTGIASTPVDVSEVTTGEDLQVSFPKVATRSGNQRVYQLQYAVENSVVYNAATGKSSITWLVLPPTGMPIRETKITFVPPPAGDMGTYAYTAHLALRKVELFNAAGEAARTLKQKAEGIRTIRTVPAESIVVDPKTAKEIGANGSGIVAVFSGLGVLAPDEGAVLQAQW